MHARPQPQIEEIASLTPPALIATVHDPDGRLLDAARRHGDLLTAYATGYFRCTPATDRRVRDALNHAGYVSVGEPNRIGQSRREALRLAREDSHEAFLYCDFDRWLHWAESYSEELATLPEEIARDQPAAWYVCLGRTPRAFATHPRVQRETEAHSNQVISLLTGRPLDATAGACWMTAPAADIILSASIETSNATDLEWPALIAVRGGSRLGSRRVEGLEFETATFHQPEIRAAGGLDAWLARHYDRQDVWEARRRLMAESVRAAQRVFDGAPLNALSCD